MEKKIYIITRNDDNRRLDRIVLKLFPQLPMSLIYKSLRTGKIKLNDGKAKPADRVKTGDELQIAIADAQASPRTDNTARLLPAIEKNLKPFILFENRHVLAINKQRGVLVHGSSSLEELVQQYLLKKIEPSLSFRPGPLHRLDRNTTGLVLFSVSLEGAQELTNLFKKRLCEKYYFALCDGIIEAPALWQDTIKRNRLSQVSYRGEGDNAQEAITRVIPVFSGKKHTLALMKIHTGRTHQIRIQAAIHKHPLAGDKKYRGSGALPVYLLHAAALRLTASSRIAGFSTLLAPLPESAQATLCNVLNPGVLKKAMHVLREELRK